MGESSVVPGYFVCLATTGFTLMPLLARMLAEHIASGSAASAKLLSRSTIVPTGPDHLRGRT